MRYNAIWIGEQVLMFQRGLLPPVQGYVDDPEDGSSRVLQTIWKYFPGFTASYPRRLKSSLNCCYRI